MRDYEVLVHDPVVLAAFNMAANDYSYLFIRHNHNLRPSCVLYVDGLPPALAPFIPALIVPSHAIPVADIARAVARRNTMRIRVRGLIVQAAPAILAGDPVPNRFIRSAQNGGYLAPLANFLHRLIIPATYAGLPLTDRIVIHISLPKRVSKNMDELKNQSSVNPAGLTIKGIIDNIYTGAGLPVPDSITVVSYTN